MSSGKKEERALMRQKLRHVTSPGSGVAIEHGSETLTATVGSVLALDGERYLLTAHHPFVGVPVGTRVSSCWFEHGEDDEMVVYLSDEIGTIEFFSSFSTSSLSNTEDFALIKLDRSAKATSRYPHRLHPPGLETIPLHTTGGMRVHHCGAESCYRKGTFTGFLYNLTFPCHNGSLAKFSCTVIEAEPAIRKRKKHPIRGPLDFCLKGDSGSVVFTRDSTPLPVGLLLGHHQPDEFAAGLLLSGYVMPMRNTLDGIFKATGRKVRFDRKGWRWKPRLRTP